MTWRQQQQRGRGRGRGQLASSDDFSGVGISINLWRLQCEVCLMPPRAGFALVPCRHARFCESCAMRVFVALERIRTTLNLHLTDCCNDCFRWFFAFCLLTFLYWTYNIVGACIRDVMYACVRFVCTSWLIQLRRRHFTGYVKGVTCCFDSFFTVCWTNRAVSITCYLISGRTLLRINCVIHPFLSCLMCAQHVLRHLLLTTLLIITFDLL